MKIAVVGCGAVGSFYGAKLARAGHQVHFLLRSDYDVVRRRGVYVRSTQGDFRVHPKCALSPEEIGPGDLVLVALKTTANHQFGRLLPPLVGAQSAVMTLQNGLGNEEQLARFFPVEQILGGLCFVCLNRLEPGVIHHIDHGQVIIGEFRRWPEPRTHDIASVFRHAGVPCSVTENLAQAHWEKLTWNIPFNGLGVAGTAGYEAVISGKTIGASLAGPEGDSIAAGNLTEPAPPTSHEGYGPPPQPCLTTDKLLADPGWAALVRELMLEVISAARKLDFHLEDSLAEKQIERTRTMGAYKASTLIDFERGRPLELETLFLEPLRQAQQAAVPVPRLQAMCRILCALQRSRR